MKNYVSLILLLFMFVGSVSAQQLTASEFSNPLWDNIPEFERQANMELIEAWVTDANEFLTMSSSAIAADPDDSIRILTSAPRSRLTNETATERLLNTVPIASLETLSDYCDERGGFESMRLRRSIELNLASRVSQEEGSEHRYSALVCLLAIEDNPRDFVQEALQFSNAENEDGELQSRSLGLIEAVSGIQTADGIRALSESYYTALEARNFRMTGEIANSSMKLANDESFNNLMDAPTIGQDPEMKLLLLEFLADMGKHTNSLETIDWAIERTESLLATYPDPTGTRLGKLQFYRAALLFSHNSYSPASDAFQQAIVAGLEPDLLLESYYLMGRCADVQSRHDDWDYYMNEAIVLAEGDRKSLLQQEYTALLTLRTQEYVPAPINQR